MLEGRAFTTDGAFTTDSISTMMPSGCVGLGVTTLETNESLNIYPNPFTNQLTILLNTTPAEKCEFILYNVLGAEMINSMIVNQSSTFDTSTLPSGVYFYKVMSNGTIIQTGKLVSKK